MDPITTPPLWLFGIAGTVIMILLGIVGYFFNRTLNSVDKLADSVEKLSLTTTSLRATIQAQKEDIDDLKISHVERFEKIEGKLEDHGKKIEENTTEIKLIKEREKLNV
jgi:cell division protein FtsB